MDTKQKKDEKTRAPQEGHDAKKFDGKKPGPEAAVAAQPTAEVQKGAAEAFLSAHPTADVLKGHAGTAQPAADVLEKPAETLKEQMIAHEQQVLNYELHRAVADSDIRRAERMLEKGADPNSCMCNIPILSCAVTEGNKKMVKLLLEHGADVNQKDFYGNTALVRSLQYHGSWGRGNTCKGMVTMLIDKGADVTAKDCTGKSVYELATERNWEHLLPKDVIAPEKAKYEAHAEERRQAKEKADAERKEREVREEAERQQRAEKQKLQEVLFYEITHDNIKGIEDVLAKGADINGPVHNEFPITKVCRFGCKPETLKFLLEKGANVNAVETIEYNATPLLIAAERGDADTVKVLLQYKADVNAKTKGESTPLIKALINGDSPVRREIAMLLIEAGADVMLENGNGDTALGPIVRNPVLLELTLKKGLSPNAIVSVADGRTLLMAAAKKSAKGTEMLLNAGADVHAKDKAGKTALYYAAMEHDAEIVKMLLEKGAKVGDILDDYESRHSMPFSMYPFEMEMCWMQGRMKHMFNRNFEDMPDKSDKVHRLLKEAKEKESTPENMRKALEVLQNAGSLVVIVPLQNITDELKSQLSTLLSQHGITFVKKDETVKDTADAKKTEGKVAPAEVAKVAEAQDKCAKVPASPGIGDAVFGIATCFMAEDASAMAQPSPARESSLDWDIRSALRSMDWDYAIRLLHEAKADINEVDPEGRTYLMEALQHEVPRYETVHKLLSMGADPNRKDKMGDTALKMAKRTLANKDIVALLLEHGAKE